MQIIRTLGGFLAGAVPTVVLVGCALAVENVQAITKMNWKQIFGMLIMRLIVIVGLAVLRRFCAP
jgi:hypothetical protein